MGGWKCADADNYHPKANVEKMKSGIPLTDSDRMPWLDRLNRLLRGWIKGKKHGVLACSALKRIYRQVLMAGLKEEIMFLYLHLSPQVVTARMNARKNHFMPPSLIQSQFAALELPDPDVEPCVVIDASKSLEFVVQVCRAQIHEWLLNSRIPKPPGEPVAFPVEIPPITLTPGNAGGGGGDGGGDGGIGGGSGSSIIDTGPMYASSPARPREEAGGGRGGGGGGGGGRSSTTSVPFPVDVAPVMRRRGINGNTANASPRRTGAAAAVQRVSVHGVEQRISSLALVEGGKGGGGRSQQPGSPARHSSQRHSWTPQSQLVLNAMHYGQSNMASLVSPSSPLRRPRPPSSVASPQSPSLDEQLRCDVCADIYSMRELNLEAVPMDFVCPSCQKNGHRTGGPVRMRPASIAAMPSVSLSPQRRSSVNDALLFGSDSGTKLSATDTPAVPRMSDALPVSALASPESAENTARIARQLSQQRQQHHPVVGRTASESVASSSSRQPVELPSYDPGSAMIPCSQCGQYWDWFSTYGGGDPRVPKPRPGEWVCPSCEGPSLRRFNPDYVAEAGDLGASSPAASIRPVLAGELIGPPEAGDTELLCGDCWRSYSATALGITQPVGVDWICPHCAGEDVSVPPALPPTSTSVAATAAAAAVSRSERGQEKGQEKVKEKESEPSSDQIKTLSEENISPVARSPSISASISESDFGFSDGGGTSWPGSPTSPTGVENSFTLPPPGPREEIVTPKLHFEDGVKRKQQPSPGGYGFEDSTLAAQALASISHDV